MSNKLSKLRRRDFLKLATAGGLALAIPLLGSRLASMGSTNSKVSPFETSFDAIGTNVSIIIDDDIATSSSNLAAASVSDEITRLEKVLTRFSGGNDLFILNQEDNLESPSPDLVAVLQKAKSYSQSTEGSFDVTVKPVLDLFQGYLSGQPFPTDAQLESAKNLIDFENITVSSSFAGLSRQGVGVTLDGIATGYILDSSIRLLKSRGIASALVNFGGTLATIGSRADGSPWKVGVVDPIDPTKTIGTLHLRDQAVATSGDYEDYFTQDKSWYHIVDPGTAHSPLFSHSATVVAPTAIAADPLGVALMVESPSVGMKIADSFGVECLLCTRNDGIMTSSGMKQLMS